eukprot:TRINITY_DN3253_c1_g1_i1.p1 TRINITY_DN3253_c1_g1~~TRINITY_DN3253_c1_g1_i1.p1  ORF type:complete len:314 (+),score=92.69 TRINITY_DN3253_c1_g1_i1:55-942(+)
MPSGLTKAAAACAAVGASASAAEPDIAEGIAQAISKATPPEAGEVARQSAKEIATGVVVSGLTGAALASLAWSRGLRAWRARRFLDTLQISINSFEPARNRFVFRTIHEAPLADLLPPAGCNEVIKAAQSAQTTSDHLLDLSEQTEYVVYNRIGNLVSSGCARQWFSMDMQSDSVREEPYVIALTAEPPTASGAKLRAMLLRRSTLAKLAAMPLDQPLPNASAVTRDAARHYAACSFSQLDSSASGGLARWRLMLRLAHRYCDEAGLTPEELAVLPHDRWPTKHRFWNVMMCVRV